MHLALLHDGRPALLRVEGRVGAPAALFFHPFPLHADAWEEMLAACASAGLCAAALDAPGFGGTPPLGRALSMECIARAKRDASPIIALHTSPIMKVALPMYLKMGFVKAYDAPPIFGVAYAVYTKAL